MTIALGQARDPQFRTLPGIPRREGLGLEAERRLRRSGDLALQDVSSEAHAGIVRLRGRLPSYDLKQMAQAIVADIEGVRRVVNLIEITVPPGRPPLGHERNAGVDEPIGIEPTSQSWEGPSPSEHPGRSVHRCWS